VRKNRKVRFSAARQICHPCLDVGSADQSDIARHLRILTPPIRILLSLTSNFRAFWKSQSWKENTLNLQISAGEKSINHLPSISRVLSLSLTISWAEHLENFFSCFWSVLRTLMWLFNLREMRGARLQQMTIPDGIKPVVSLSPAMILDTCFASACWMKTHTAGMTSLGARMFCWTPCHVSFSLSLSLILATSASLFTHPTPDLRMIFFVDHSNFVGFFIIIFAQQCSHGHGLMVASAEPEEY
jgi:hypothetical protein